MRNLTQWFFIIGCFAFLYWYTPVALQDNKMTIFEISTISVNVLCFLIHWSGLAGRIVGK